MADKPQKCWQARSEFNERRYRRVDTRVWNDARVRGFSPTGRLVWVLLLTAPSTTAIPGLFRMREEEGAALCGLTLEGFREGFAEGFRLGLVEADWVAGVVWVRKASRYEWPTAPNVVKNWRKVLRSEIPESHLVARAMSQIREELQRVYDDPEPFNQAFAEAFPEGFAKGFTEPFAEGSPAQDAGCRMQDAGTFSFPPSAPASAAPEQRSLLPTCDMEAESGTTADVQQNTPPSRQKRPATQRKARGGGNTMADTPPAEPAPFKAACDMLTRVYADVRKADYGFGLNATRNGKAVRELLWGDGAKGQERGEPLVPLEELERRWRIGLSWKGFPACNAIWDLKDNWAAYAQSQGGGSEPAPVVPIRRLVEM